MNKDVVRVLDHGKELTISFDDCILYHGVDSIGGLALGFRMMQWAINEMSPNVAPDRETISFKTAFPGPGLRDAVEMIARVVTRGAYTVLQEIPVQAPEGVYGHMYFEVTVGEQTRRISLAPGALPEEFVQTGRAIKAGNADEDLKKRWTELKHGLSEAVLGANFKDLIVLHP